MERVGRRRVPATTTIEETAVMHTAIAEIEQAQTRSDIPAFRPGDTLKVHVRVTEGNRSRIQVFQGVVIRRPGDVHRPQGQLRRGRGADLPGAQPVDRQDRARRPGPGAPRQAVLPEGTARQEGPHQGASRPDRQLTPVERAGEVGGDQQDPGTLAPASTSEPDADSAKTEPDKDAPAAKKKKSFGRELLTIVVAAAILTLLAKAFIIQVYRIPSASMENT